MKIGKRIFYLVVGLIMLIGLVACSAENTSSNNKGESKNTENKGLAQGVTDDKILIGTTGPQTGAAALYDSFRKGADSYFKYVNENGGVNGRQLEFIAYDDQYQPAMTLQNAKKLVEEDKVFTLINLVGTPTNKAAKDYIIEKGIPVTMIATGSSSFTNPPIANYMGSSLMNYAAEIAISLDYAVKKLGVKKIAMAYPNDDYGKEVSNNLRERIKKYPDVEIIEEVTFLATDTEFSSQAQKLSNANPDAIFYLSTPGPAANLKKALYKIGVTDIPYIVSSVGGNDSNLFNLAGKEVWEGSISSATLAVPENVPNDEDMKTFVERFSKDYPKDSTTGFSQLGWASAQVLVEALKRTGEELTWENYLNSFYTFDNWDGSLFKGISFSEENHFGVTSMFMTEAKNGTIEPITGTITFDPVSDEIIYKDEE